MRSDEDILDDLNNDAIEDVVISAIVIGAIERKAIYYNKLDDKYIYGCRLSGHINNESLNDICDTNIIRVNETHLKFNEYYMRTKMTSTNKFPSFWKVEKYNFADLYDVLMTIIENDYQLPIVENWKLGCVFK